VDFLSAGFLFALPLVALPVLIHLLNRRQKQVIHWGAMQFLLESSTRRRRLWRIDDLIVMLLRALTVMLIVLALARPQLFSSWLGSPTGRDVTLIIDGSLSTSLRSGTGVVFDKIKERAADVVSEFQDGDNVRVMLSLGSPKWLTPVGTAASTETRQQLRQMIGELKPTQATADIASSVQTALASEPAVSSRTRYVIVVTDDCAHGWQSESAARWNAVQKTIEFAEVPTVVNVLTVTSGNSEIANLSVDRIEATRNIVGVDEPVTFTVDVRNSGESPGQPVAVRWSINDEPLGITSVPALQTGQTSTVQLQHAIKVPGAYRIQCRIDHTDDVKLDDSKAMVVEVTNKVPILIVQSTDGDRDELQYLLAALGRPEDSGNVTEIRASVFEPTLVRVHDLGTINPAAFRAVMIINPGSIPELVHRRLANYVSTGGGLWVSLGDHTDVATFNTEFYNANQGLSPLPIQAPLGNAADHEQFMLVSPPSAEYGPTRLLGDIQRLDIDDVRIYRHVPFVVGENNQARVLLETNLGRPLAIEGHMGDGRIILMGLPHDLDWSSLPLCRSYVAMVHEWLWHITEPLATRRNLLPGSPIRLPVSEVDRRGFDQADAVSVAHAEDSLPTTPAAVVEMPGGEKRVIHATGDGQSSAFVFRDTVFPGNYTVTLSGIDDGQFNQGTSSPFTVIRNASESDLKTLTAENRNELAKIGGIHFVSQPWSQPQGQVAGSTMQPIAGLLLIAFVLILLCELLLAGWSARQRFDPPQRRLREAAANID
jgi:hypothetical protein